MSKSQGETCPYCMKSGFRNQATLSIHIMRKHPEKLISGGSKSKGW